MPLPLPQSGLIFNNYIDYTKDKIRVTTSPEEMNDLNILFLASGAYHTISGEPSPESKKAFNDSLSYVMLDTYTHVPPDPKRQKLFIYPKDKDKVFPKTVLVDEGGQPPKQIPFDLYNQNFFLVSVAKTRKVVLELSQKLQDAANVLRSNINSASSKVLLAFQSFSENRYVAKEFTISSKTIAVLDQMFSDDAGLLAIPTVKGISDKETLAKLEAEGGETSTGVPIAEAGDLGAVNVSLGFGFAGSDVPEGFAGTGFDSTGAGVTDPEFGGNQGGTPPDPPPDVPGSGGGGTGGGTGDPY